MAIVGLVLLWSACSGGGGTGGGSPQESSPRSAPNPDRNAYFGDLHVHTRYSFDAFIFGTVATPDDAYRFAKGDTIPHPGGLLMALDRPLDFQAVTDHAMYLGMLPAMTEHHSNAYKYPVAKQLRLAETDVDKLVVFRGIFGKGGSNPLDPNIVRSAWNSLVDSAEKHNDPGKFTTFIAFEYTSDGGGEANNLHRNVIFRGSKHPDLPFSRLESMNPEDLWEMMDGWRADGMEVLAIPHNSNGSGGRMFEMTKYEGDPIDKEYVETRTRNEPIVEISQVKGTSETHPALSPNDEWANFEIVPYKVATYVPSEPAGSYVRDAYKRGLELADGPGNAYKYGMIGSSDTHIAAGSFDEDNYWSKVGLLDMTPEERGSVPSDIVLELSGDPALAEPSSARTDDGSGRQYPDTYFHTWGPSGLAGVWAEENTREALFDAMRRKETFGTSGTRIRVRFFGGADLISADMDAEGFVSMAYDKAVPMGQDYPDADGVPTFAVWALRDPLNAPLQRVQIIKGWREGEGSHEKVFDVACADGAAVDPSTHRCPNNGAAVNMETCEPTGSGANELKVIWTDPEFKTDARAFYYVRALENPTCRWSSWDAIRYGEKPRQDMPATIQERAWSSPIWYNPR